MTSLIKKFLSIDYKEGTASVPNAQITTLASISTSDSNANYLLIGCVIPQSTNSSAMIQARWGPRGVIVKRDRIDESVTTQAIGVMGGNGSTTAFSTYQNSGGAISVRYKVWSIKL